MILVSRVNRKFEKSNSRNFVPNTKILPCQFYNNPQRDRRRLEVSKTNATPSCFAYPTALTRRNLEPILLFEHTQQFHVALGFAGLLEIYFSNFLFTFYKKFSLELMQRQKYLLMNLNIIGSFSSAGLSNIFFCFSKNSFSTSASNPAFE